MTVTTPNTSTSGTVGTPSPAPIATESLDNSVAAAASDNIQWISLVNIAVQMRNALNLIAQALSVAPDYSGRLRVVLDTGAGQQSLNIVSTVSSVSSVAKLGSSGPDASTMTTDAMQNAWASSINPTITRT
jgi:hypothetical protein